MNENNPKISVIVPVYNAEKYIHRCIDSIMLQTFTDFELLLIDDGSNDISGNICDEYASKDKRIRVFHKENGGASSARNLGLDKARGEYICFCDADDFVEQNWLYNFSSEIHNYDLLVSGFCIYDINQSTKIMRMPCIENKLQIIEYLESESITGFLWCKCFKHAIIENFKLRFNEKFVIWEDLDFIYRYLIHTSKIKLNSEVIYNYFMPDLGMKYVSKISFECCESLLSSILCITYDKSHFIYKKYLRAAKNCLKNDIRSFSYIKSIHELIKYFCLKNK